MKSLAEVSSLVLTRSHFERQNVSRHALSRLKQDGEMIGLRRGVYIETQRWNELNAWEKYAAEAIAFSRVSPQSVFSHQTAALLHGLWVIGEPPQKLHIVTSPHSRGSSRMIIKHPHLTPLTPTVTLPLGMRTTTLQETVVQCARVLPQVSATAIADSALHLKKVSLAELKSHLNSYEGYQKAQVYTVSELMSAKSESPGETGTRLLLREMKLEFVEQYQIWLHGYSYRVDFYIPSLGIIIEFDGNLKYTDFGSRGKVEENERFREKVLQNAGYVVFRTTWRRVFFEPEQFKDELGGLISRLKRRRHS